MPVGKFGRPSEEVAHFGAPSSLAFPASEIQTLEWQENSPAEMTVNFMGLTGSQGYLPYWYSNLIAERLRSGDSTLQDFLRIFDHRFISLFYQAWERYRFPVAYERGDRDRFSQLLLYFVGMGTAGLNPPVPIEENAFLFYAGLFAQRPRSAEALRCLLEDYFEVPTEIDQFLGSWFALDEANIAQLGERETLSESLGGGMVIGDEVWDQQARARVRLGPLTLDQYRSFLPGQPAYSALQVLTRFFAGDEIDFDLQLVLRREEVPCCELSQTQDQSPRLGWVSWVRTSDMDTDPSDTVLPL
jgi:type VI secretion system protein ImpH